MLEIGVEGDLFHPHLPTPICQSRGCVPMPAGWSDPWAPRDTPG